MLNEKRWRHFFEEGKVTQDREKESKRTLNVLNSHSSVFIILESNWVSCI